MAKQALAILVVAPAAGYAIDLIISPLWPDLRSIKRLRWILFLIPAVAISSLIAWQYIAMPEVQHRLEIIPMTENGTKEVRLLEVRGAYGNVVPISRFANAPGWGMLNETLVSSSAAPSPIVYSFLGPINEQVRVTFLASPRAGGVQVRLDGQQAVLDLAGPDGDQRRTRLDTQYVWGLLNFLIVPLIFAADTLTAATLLAVLWLIQEITQKHNSDLSEQAPERFFSHAHGLLIVCTLALVLHALHFLAVPLAVLKDSPSYLQGAAYWLRHHSLDGVSSYRGLGTTVLFAPAMFLFGRNPWGVKLVLHLLAFACVPVSYRLGWQLGRRRWFAFSTALITALLPDLYTYSSYVLSEAPHVFFGLLFCTLLISALDSMSFGWILAALLTASFAVLVRAESLVALLVGIGFMVGRMLWLRKVNPVQPPGHPLSRITSWGLVLAIALAAAPLLGWSLHDKRVYGFFGLSDYGGAALYDGWIYFGENSHIPITDHASPATRVIDTIYASEGRDQPELQTSWTIYYSLLSHGYTSEEAFSLLQRATVDSILKDPVLSWKLLLVKLRQGFEPHPYIAATFPLPGENSHSSPPSAEALNAQYFDAEPVVFSPLVFLQRGINSFVGACYQRVFFVWFWAGLVALFLSLYRKPFFIWVPLTVIAAGSIFVPTILGMSMWRYVLLGTVLMQYPLLAWIQSAARFITHYFQIRRTNRPPMSSEVVP